MQQPENVPLQSLIYLDEIESLIFQAFKSSQTKTNKAFHSWFNFSFWFIIFT